MKARVIVYPREEILDPQGQAICEALGRVGFDEVEEVRAGKSFDIELKARSRAAAENKGIASPVAGDADILVAPDLESGNMIAKQLIHLAGAEAAGIVLGARVPIMLTSRADDVLARLASAAIAQLYVRRHAEGAL